VVDRVRIETTEGRPGTVVPQYASEEGIDHVVIYGSQSGSTGFLRRFLGRGIAATVVERTRATGDGALPRLKLFSTDRTAVVRPSVERPPCSEHRAATVNGSSRARNRIRSPVSKKDGVQWFLELSTLSGTQLPMTRANS